MYDCSLSSYYMKALQEVYFEIEQPFVTQISLSCECSIIQMLHLCAAYFMCREDVILENCLSQKYANI
jgi:hypothetical protein